MQYLLPFTFFLLLAAEGLGVQFGREITYFLILFASAILFVHMFFAKKKIVFPKTLSILFIIFLIFSFISTAFGVNFQKSIEYSFFLVSLFAVFLLSYNFSSSLEKPLTILIFTLSFLFSIYYLLLNFHLLNLFIPQNGYQFVFPFFSSHNHLGDFLVVPIVICLFYLYNRKNTLPNTCYLILATCFTVFAFSRSAYFSIAVCALFLHLDFIIKNQTRVYKLIFRLFILVFIFSSLFFLLATTKQAEKQPISSSVNKYLVEKEGLDKYKELSASRPEYFREAFLSIQKHPILGIGPNNFLYVSRLYSKNPSQTTETTHNIFLEVLVGQGILGFLPFAGLILLILVKSQKNALYFAMLAMLINFQTDYTYQIYSFLLLFFALAGTISREEKPT